MFFRTRSDILLGRFSNEAGYGNVNATKQQIKGIALTDNRAAHALHFWSISFPFSVKQQGKSMTMPEFSTVPNRRSQ